jgi:hypothetical protein
MHDLAKRHAEIIRKLVEENDELKAQLMKAEAKVIIVQARLDASDQHNKILIESTCEMQAQVELLKTYTQHKVGCKWNSKPVAKVNMFEVIRQPCSCGLQAATKGDKS